VESDKGPLRRMHEAFRTALIHDLTQEGFADTYAQTITYGLLTAAISRTDRSAGADGTFVLAEDIHNMVPITNPFLKEMLESFLKVGGRGTSKQPGLDFDELGVQEVVELLRSSDIDLPAVLEDFGNRNPGEDPVIRFYEDFLKAYNKELKIKRGVFYTPQPVVSYIVRSVHELLQTEFGISDGLASTITWGEMAAQMSAAGKSFSIPDGTSPDSHFVVILDPATGTATFLVEVIDVIFHALTKKWKAARLTASQQREEWNRYVPAHLLPRLFGYELMMAPYAIAHMKIGLKLHETGYGFTHEARVCVYLTNTLEVAQDFSDRFEFDVPALAHEAAAVNYVKRSQRYTVIVGNPPYAGISSNMTEEAQRLVDPYKFVDGKALKERKLWLQDDYVKFIRVAQALLDQAGSGVLGYITNHGYLDNPTFRGMRQNLMASFQKLRVLDLHGNANKKEEAPDGSEDKNVFDIRQGVSICLASRLSGDRSVLHGDLWGLREAKYVWLNVHNLETTPWIVLSPDAPYYFFEQQDISFRVEYDRGWKISEAMPINSAGFITARDHFVVAFDQEELFSRIADFANAAVSDEAIREKYFVGCGSDKYPDGDTRSWKLPEARERVMADKRWRERVKTCLYRPFDKRQVYWTEAMVDWPRPELSRHLALASNMALITTRITKDAFAIFVTNDPPGHKSVGAYDVNYVFPLYCVPPQRAQTSITGLSDDVRPNFAPQFLQALALALRLPADGFNGMPAGISPEDIFYYIYAVCHDEGYQERYAEFLKIDFPRIPLALDVRLFHALSGYGNRLAKLHSLDLELGTDSIAVYDGAGAPFVEKISRIDDKVWLDKKETYGFRLISDEVWDFHVGGYQVCEKWLKDRKGRILSGENIDHYLKMLTSISRTILIVAEIHELIEEHGGWPVAFA
jgi:predicted helicase